MRLAVVGAGVCGLAAAQRLRRDRPGLEVIVYERERQVGGRVATRRRQGAAFDYGAQYVKAESADFERLLRETLAHDTLADIARPVWIFDGEGRIQPGDPAQNADPKWTYADGLARLPRELARGLAVQRGVTIQRLKSVEGGFRLLDPRGAALGEAEAVLLTPPAPETAALLAASELPSEPRDRLLDELGRVCYRPCLSFAFGFPAQLRPRPWYALVNVDRRHAVNWLAYEHLKPGRASSGQQVVLAQMAPGWSTQRWQQPLRAAIDEVVGLLGELLDEPLPGPLWSDRAAWRYALPDGRADSARLNAALPGVLFAGDYTAGQGRVHLAVEEGWRAAEVIGGLFAN